MHGRALHDDVTAIGGLLNDTGLVHTASESDEGSRLIASELEVVLHR